jgi:hypothetical protein
MIATSCLSDNSDMEETEKKMVLNQILYIVKNMILFNFSESEVKEFASKFTKMLKQDEQFLNDVYVIVDGCRSALRMRSQRRESSCLQSREHYKTISSTRSSMLVTKFDLIYTFHEFF